jgi:hypothetical protein
MKSIGQFFTAALVVCVLAGCGSPQLPPPPADVGQQATLNNCYSLLHQLLDEQKDVSLLSLIKREHSDLKNLMKRIAHASAAGANLLEEFARKDPSINLEDIELPPGEVAVRSAIAAAKKKELLSQKGDEFELTLLLSQTEALSYGTHLAKVAAEKEPQLDRAHSLAGMSDDMGNLYREAFVMILSKMQSPPANPGASQK